MSGDDSWDELRQEIIRRITPKEEEVKRVQRFQRKTEEELTGLLHKAGLNAVAESHGSTARGTWLSGDNDVDIFLVLDPKYDRSMLLKALDVAKSYVGPRWIESYAEHPYIQAKLEGFQVEFVPCFRIESGRGIISSTDRTPLHTRYVREHLNPAMHDEVRLLKKFAKGIGVYGAEVRIGGFSGYLCELLVVLLGPFESVLRRASGWRTGEIIGSYNGRAEDVRKRFGEPLIVIDPVDPQRNAASAVGNTSMWTFVAAARAFLNRSTEIFFFPKESVVETSALLEVLDGHVSKLVFLVVEDSQVPVPDVLWGQLYKAEKAISRSISKGGFGVFRSAVWSDEASRHILIFELSSTTIPAVVKSKGPPVEMAENSEKFVKAHYGAESTISGPWIEGERWWIETMLQQPDAQSMLESVLADGGRSIGVPKRLSETVKRNCRILTGTEIAEYLQPDFVKFLDRFIKGRPSWLE